MSKIIYERERYKIILELKDLCNLTAEHDSQRLNDLKAANLKLGILINFGDMSHKFKRIVL